jgi:hypothetical protein
MMLTRWEDIPEKNERVGLAIGGGASFSGFEAGAAVDGVVGPNAAGTGGTMGEGKRNLDVSGRGELDALYCGGGVFNMYWSEARFVTTKGAKFLDGGGAWKTGAGCWTALLNGLICGVHMASGLALEGNRTGSLFFSTSLGSIVNRSRDLDALLRVQTRICQVRMAISSRELKTAAQKKESYLHKRINPSIIMVTMTASLTEEGFIRGERLSFALNALLVYSKMTDIGWDKRVDGFQKPSVEVW